MFRYLVFFITFFSASLGAIAYDITGRVVASPDNEPEPYATVALYAAADTVSPLATVVADDMGVFSLRHGEPGDFIVTVSSVGRADAAVPLTAAGADVDLGSIVLHPDGTLLGEVVVSAQRPLITREIDRIGYDVQADPDAETSTLTEMLRKVPMVSVDGEGNITVKNSSFKVYKNGRPNQSFTRNTKDIFAALPASSIKRIEVITDPGAKEDAEGTGVILNIVTVDDSPIKGVLGTASVSLTSNLGIPLPRLWLTSQIDKVNFSVSGGYNHQTYHSTKAEERAKGTYHTTGNTFEETSVSRSESDNGWGNLEMSYDLDSLNLFTAEVGVSAYNGRAHGADRVRFLAGENPIYSYTNSYTRPLSRYTDLSGVFNYQHSTRRKGETLTLSYQISSTRQSLRTASAYEDAVNLPVDYTGVDSSTKLRFIEHTFQIDWVHPFNSHHKLDLGAKYIFRQNHSVSSHSYTGLRDTYDDFRHRTQVGAAYFDYRLSYGPVSVRAGMRYEYSRLDARFLDGSTEPFGSDLNDFVPNAAVMWQVNDANSLRVNFTTSIQRPGISYLNPAVNESPYIVSFGNPDLESARVNNLSLDYSLTASKVYLNAQLFYVFSNNEIGPMRNVEGDVIYSTYDNGDRQRMGYGSVYFQFTPTERTQLSLNLMGGYGRCYSPRTGAKVQRWVWKPSISLSQRLPWRLRASLGVYYDDGYVNSIYQYNVPVGAARFYYSLALQRSFLKDDRLTVRLYGANLFLPSTQRSRTYSVNSDYTGIRDRYMFLRQYGGITVSLRFGSLKSEVKKVERTINNDDLQGKRM